MERLIPRHYLSRSEIAKYFDVTPRSVNKWFQSKEIPFRIFKGLNNKPTSYALLSDVKKYLIKHSWRRKKHVLKKALS